MLDCSGATGYIHALPAKLKNLVGSFVWGPPLGRPRTVNFAFSPDFLS